MSEHLEAFAVAPWEDKSDHLTKKHRMAVVFSDTHSGLNALHAQDHRQMKYPHGKPVASPKA